MIAPPEPWTRLTAPDEILAMTKDLGLTPKTFTEPKPLFYSGVYVQARTSCQLAGYIDKSAVVIEVNGMLHTIHPECLKEMQKGSKSRGLEVGSGLPDYTIFDIETTGLSKTDEIIEISAIRVKEDRVTIVDTFDELVKPSQILSPDIIQLTGITDTMLADKPKISEVMPRFLEFIEGSILVGHNIKTFDVPFCNRYAEKCGCRIKNKIIDTLPFARDCLELEHHTLGDIAKALQITPGTAHRAMGDCETTLHCFQALCKMQDPQTYLRAKQAKPDDFSISIDGYKLDISFSSELPSKKKISQAEVLKYRSTPKAKEMKPTTDLFDPAHPLFDLTCVITGEMQEMSRKQAMQRIVDCGGHVADNVTKKTDILVIGADADPEKKSGKQKKAEAYLAAGQSIRILTEPDFLTLLDCSKKME